MKPYCVAVDLGATNVRVALGEGTKIISILSEETDKFHDSQGISDQIIRLIRALMDRVGIREVESIGIGSIGPLDLKNGVIVGTPNLPFSQIALIKPVSQAFEVPIKLLNDCRAAALGEHALGAGRGLKNIVYVTLSTGIGGGIIVDGHLLNGKDGNAGEIGHFTVNSDSPLVCGCGRRGHWEAYCSGKNISKYTRLLLEEAKKSEMYEFYSEPHDLFKAAERGDELALWITTKIGKMNTLGFANIINAYDPEVISVGGSVALNNPELILKPIRENISNYAINRVPPIVLTPLGGEAVLYGALVLAEQSVE